MLKCLKKVLIDPPALSLPAGLSASVGSPPSARPRTRQSNLSTFTMPVASGGPDAAPSARTRSVWGAFGLERVRRETGRVDSPAPARSRKARHENGRNPDRPSAVSISFVSMIHALGVCRLTLEQE